MSTASMPTIAPAEHATVLHGVTWDDYVRYRDDPENDGSRMTYSDGVLEIMTLSFFHESVSFLIHNLITVWQIHHNIDIQPSGSMTLRSKLVEKGLEGDQSYYIRHAAEVMGQAQIDVEQLPPDLAVEVDHTRSSVPKIPIYEALGVPEVWRWRKETLTVLRLEDGEYVEHAESVALPGFPLDHLRQALARRNEVSQTSLIREFQNGLFKKS
ncbi:MAG: Uma2 family endonuclease [Planctomycetota bacterium]|nr:Uma2 family endonuclease [Planctomycetota bacterium]